ncbi:MAG: hypothetical protein WBD21_08100, partial [Candidatus Acidiferrales bacterium]
AEHSFLLVIVSAHSLVSLNLFTSDEFFQLKLHKKRVFQQAARAISPSNTTQNRGECASFLSDSWPRTGWSEQPPLIASVF